MPPADVAAEDLPFEAMVAEAMTVAHGFLAHLVLPIPTLRQRLAWRIRAWLAFEDR